MRTRQRVRRDLNHIRLAMAILWTVVIIMLCWLPATMVRELEDESAWFQIPNLDKVVHSGIFVVFSILWARLGSSWRRFVWIALAGFGLAVVTELVQNPAVVSRDGSIADTITDVFGLLIGLALAPLVEPMARLIESRVFPRTASPTVTMDRTTATVDAAHGPSN